MVLRNECGLQLAWIYTFINSPLTNSTVIHTIVCWSQEKGFMFIWWAKFTITRFARRKHFNSTFDGLCNQQTNVTFLIINIHKLIKPWLLTLYVHRCCMVYFNITKISWKGIAPRGAVPRSFLEHNYTYKTYMQYKIFKFSYISIENGLTWLMTWMFTTTNNL